MAGCFYFFVTHQRLNAEYATFLSGVSGQTIVSFFDVLPFEFGFWAFISCLVNTSHVFFLLLIVFSFLD